MHLLFLPFLCNKCSPSGRWAGVLVILFPYNTHSVQRDSGSQCPPILCAYRISHATASRASSVHVFRIGGTTSHYRPRTLLTIYLENDDE